MTIDELKEQYGIQYEGRLICPICGAHKVHYRLEGYRCHNASHTAQEHAFTEALIDAVLSRRISRADYDAYCFGETP